jgi:hypothetical protein
MATYVHFQHDILMRGLDMPKPLKPKLILCLGDCHTKGWLAKNSKGWPYYLSTILPDDIEVWNAGIGYYSGTFVQGMFIPDLIKLNPSLVLVQPTPPIFDPWESELIEMGRHIIVSNPDPSHRFEVLGQDNFQSKYMKWNRIHFKDINVEKEASYRLLDNLSVFKCPIMFVKFPFGYYSQNNPNIIKSLKNYLNFDILNIPVEIFGTHNFLLDNTQCGIEIGAILISIAIAEFMKKKGWESNTLKLIEECKDHPLFEVYARWATSYGLIS